jgi:hypothetical protein
MGRIRGPLAGWCITEINKSKQAGKAVTKEGRHKQWQQLL